MRFIILCDIVVRVKAKNKYYDYFDTENYDFTYQIGNYIYLSETFGPYKNLIKILSNVQSNQTKSQKNQCILTATQNNMLKGLILLVEQPYSVYE